MAGSINVHGSIFVYAGFPLDLDFVPKFPSFFFALLIRIFPSGIVLTLGSRKDNYVRQSVTITN